MLQLHSEGHSNWLRIGGGESSAGRVELPERLRAEVDEMGAPVS